MSRAYVLDSAAMPAAEAREPDPVRPAPPTLGDVARALRLIEQAGDYDGQWPEDVLAEVVAAEDVLRDAFASLAGALVVDCLARWLHASEARSAGHLAEAAELSRQAAAQTAKATREAQSRARAESMALAGMRSAGVTLARGGQYSLGLRMAGGALPVVVRDSSAVPPEFMRRAPAPAPVPDRAAILIALTAGREVAGCELGARGCKVVVK